MHCCGAASRPSDLEPEVEEQGERKEPRKPEQLEKLEKLEKLEEPERCEQVLAKIIPLIPLSAKAEEELHLQRLHRSSSNSGNSGNGEGFTLIAGIFDNMRLLQRADEHKGFTETRLIDNNEVSTEQPTLRQPEPESITLTVPLKPTTDKVWDTIRRKALAAASLKHEVDGWDLKFSFNQLEVFEDTENSLFEFGGPKSVIKNIRKNHFKAFTESFYEIVPNHTFKFIEDA